MDNLFDLDDYDSLEIPETPTIKIETNKREKSKEEKSIELSSNNFTNQNLKNQKSQKENKTISQDENSENSEKSGNSSLKKALNNSLDSLNNSFSSSENENLNNSITTEKNPKTKNKQNPELDIPYAIDDEISIDSYDNIKKPIEFPFELDVFQKRSIIRLNNHQNILVCAHTSSGKTVVAEYGIALGKKNNRRVLYTSPIKALSNQKYRDFKEKFNDVGILTGDVSINPNAQCLIMTTEILQNSLYKNNDLLTNVEYVIFDEIHYINDNERGHVWEEILILLPHGIGIIMLSATVPNYMEFAEWVGKIKKTTVYVQNTLKRIVPLEHKIFLDFDNVFLVKNSNNEILEDNIKKALMQLNNLNEKYNLIKDNEEFSKNILEKKKNYTDNIKWFERYNKKSKKEKMKKTNYFKNTIKITKMHFKIEEIVDYLVKEDLNPSVIFVFSIKRINEYGKMLRSKTLVTKAEEQKINEFFNKCIKTLSTEDQQIPQIQEVNQMLIKGIGIHHSGLLPILKEIIEILYSNGLIKILFATTSFSIGLNMPTRTVVFTDIYKFNDDKKEILTSSEYLQMCGRAGRRGIDKIGHIYLILIESKNNESKEIIDMLKGIGTEVESKFRLCYRTIISFYSRNIKGINEFFEESFLESRSAKEFPKIMEEMEILKIKAENLKKSIDCKEEKNLLNIEKYFELQNQIEDCNLTLFNEQNDINLFLVTQGKNSQGQGRILKVYDKELFQEIYVCELYYYTNYNGEIWCVKCEGKKKKIKIIQNDDENKYILNKSGCCKGIKYKYKEYYISDIQEILDLQDPRIKKISKFEEDKDGYKFLRYKDLEHILKFLLTLNSESHENLGINPINYIEEINKDLNQVITINYRNDKIKEIKNNKCYNCPLKKKHFKQYNSYLKLEKKIEEKKKTLDPKNMEHYMEFETRVKILKKLKYIDENNIITLKGKASREIGTTDCVLVSELLVSDVFEKISESEILSFICGFCSNKNEIDFTLTDKISSEFDAAKLKFENIYNKIISIEKEFDFEDNKYDRRITFSISKAMKSWMDGKSFSYILKETELEEGKLYNFIMRIYLFLEEIINFYGILGNKNMSEKFEKIKKKLLRGIMSKQSLYLEEDIKVKI